MMSLAAWAERGFLIRMRSPFRNAWRTRRTFTRRLTTRPRRCSFTDARLTVCGVTPRGSKMKAWGAWSTGLKVLVCALALSVDNASRPATSIEVIMSDACR